MSATDPAARPGPQAGGELWRRLAAELLGSALLAAVVIGSGIAAQRLSADVGLELLENAAVTAAGLFAIILMFGAVSGGHFNPVVSFADAWLGGLSWRDAAAYLPAQVAGCIGGAVLANLMFSAPAVSISVKDRASAAHFLSEIVATAGAAAGDLRAGAHRAGPVAPAAVGAYIGAAYWFTSSTSFANPAITIGRMFSNSFAGIAPASVPVVHRRADPRRRRRGGVIRLLYPGLSRRQAADAVMPRPRPAGGLDLARITGATDAARVTCCSKGDRDAPGSDRRQ